MKKELKNILIYFYLSVRHLFKGRPKESLYHLIGAFVRCYESIRDLVGKKRVTCNYCNWKGYAFKTIVSTVKLRRNAACPRCLSLDRHRTMLYFFEKIRSSVIKKDKIKVLDIAPNIAFSDYCKKDPKIDYLSIDLKSQYAMRHMDIQNIELESDWYDIIVCYHVLDYVSDDLKAMKEIFRVLNRNGIALTQEGIKADLKKTVEWGKPVQSEEYRIRQYGMDFFERWADAGFKYNYVKGENILLSAKITAPEIS